MAIKDKERVRLATNAEVSNNRIKQRGVPIKVKQELITVKSTPLGSFKKKLIAGCLGISASANAIGLGVDWTSDMVHVAYPLAGVIGVGFLLIFLTKME